MKYTKEEISLCKQVAEKHRKEVEHGDWFIWGDDYPMLASGGMSLRKGIIPLWTISDYLEFLREKEWHICYCSENMNKKYRNFMVKISESHVPFDNEKYRDGVGKTFLEACLKTVLAVLKEEK